MRTARVTRSNRAPPPAGWNLDSCPAPNLNDLQNDDVPHDEYSEGQMTDDNDEDLIVDDGPEDNDCDDVEVPQEEEMEETLEMKMTRRSVKRNVITPSRELKGNRPKVNFKPKPKDVQTTSGSSYCLYLLALSVGISVMAVIFYQKQPSVRMMWYKSFDAPEDQSIDTPWSRFKIKFKNDFIPKYLEAVPKSSIKVIKAAVKDVMLAYEDQDMERIERLSPSVILILGKEGNKNVSCFASDLEKLIASSYNEERAKIIRGEDVDVATLEYEFQRVFRDLKRHSILIDGLNKLDAKSAIHLHRYTDHDMSEFKEAIIILVGYTDDVSRLDLESSYREMDTLASSLLEKSWINSLSEDTINPLISRLTPSVTAVLHSSSPKPSTVC